MAGNDLEVRVCALSTCGRTFMIPKSSKAKYCSERCRTGARRQREQSNTMYKKGLYNGVPYDSELELRHMQALDQQGITWRRASQYRLRYYNVKERREASYYPDFIVTHQGRTILQEVKAANLVHDVVVQAKAEVARAFCADRGWVYQIVTVAGSVS